MAEEPIQNCEVRFQFRCPKQWEGLQETAEPGVRSCSQCQKQVYLCQSTQEAAQHARQGHCVAVPRWVTPRKDSSDDFEQVLTLAREHGVPAIRLHESQLDLEILKLLTREMMRKHHLIPVGRSGSTLIVAMSNPANVHAIDDVRFITGYNVEVVAVSRQDIEEGIAYAERNDPNRYELGVIAYEEEPEPIPALEGPIGKLLLLMLHNALRQGVNQIRMEATDSSLVVHYELAGKLEEVMRPPAKFREELLGQLRRASGLEQGQAGQLLLGVGSQRIHYQVRIHPTASGQEVVIQRVPKPKRAEPQGSQSA